MNLTYSTAW